MYAKEVLGGGEVTDRPCDSTVVGTVQYRLLRGEMETYRFTTLTITTVHLPPLFLIPHNGIMCVIQSVVGIRIYLKRGVGCFGLGPRVGGQWMGNSYLWCSRTLLVYIALSL